MVGPDRPRSLSTKTLDLLAAFTERRPVLTLSELGRAADLSLTTTHRIVSDLVVWGALEREGSGSYHLGLRLWEVASLAPRGVPLREAALPVMEDLYESTHENIQLAVREGLDVVYVERLAGRDAVRVLTRVGGRFALHATGVGLVLLAHAPYDVQVEVLAGELRRWTEFTVTDPARLRIVLDEVRRSGVATSDRQVTTDAVSVAAPVRGADDTVVAALSVVMHVDSPLTPMAVRPAVRAAARSISRTLGSASARAGARPPDGSS
ncbi:IclR family transcriptional regulator [Leekyejoonella antrihumi]|uniref:IclR family transcriptional regulator n=1 Tax=Leekyejoonella antrihumi TaxID=1660198 RepID=A0A563E7R1_9MICO|nr:IclR family transcriptional regulator [Leekyejoonella antrihumi]TWP38560.1 IclR family transcriptional regulator [Leekyejoonella antrihumi]